jgi:preprotein translocase subunit SecG
MITVVSVIQIVACVLLILVVLVQSGKGADISATLGGSSQTVFGSSGGANFFTRLTGVLAAIFMITAIYLTHANSQRGRSSVMDTAPPVPATAPGAPVVPGGAPAKAPAQPAGTVTIKGGVPVPPSTPAKH